MTIDKTNSNPPEDSTWLDYHREMTEGHRWFVRPVDYKPFYSNADIDVIRTAMLDYGVMYFEVFNCDWQSENWRTDVYKRAYPRYQGEDVYEYYALHNVDKANDDNALFFSVYWNGELVEMRYQDGDSSFHLVGDDFAIIKHVGMLLNRNISKDGEIIWRQWFGNGLYELDGAPIAELEPLARRINAKKWDGVYQPIIDLLVSDGLDETQI